MDCRIPRSPVLDWFSFTSAKRSALPCREGIPNRLCTTNGRAAIFLTLKTLQLPPGSAVLVPAYHGATMIAPVVHAGPEQPILIAHYFGIHRSLAKVCAWCDAPGIELIEDCAHCYFGRRRKPWWMEVYEVHSMEGSLGLACRVFRRNASAPSLGRNRDTSVSQ